jgi:hypothetical protein
MNTLVGQSTSLWQKSVKTTEAVREQQCFFSDDEGSENDILRQETDLFISQAELTVKESPMYTGSQAIYSDMGDQQDSNSHMFMSAWDGAQNRKSQLNNERQTVFMDRDFPQINKRQNKLWHRDSQQYSGGEAFLPDQFGGSQVFEADMASQVHSERQKSPNKRQSQESLHGRNLQEYSGIQERLWDRKDRKDQQGRKNEEIKLDQKNNRRSVNSSDNERRDASHSDMEMTDREDSQRARGGREKRRDKKSRTYKRSQDSSSDSDSKPLRGRQESKSHRIITKKMGDQPVGR